MEIELSSRELAHVLAAIRFMQAECDQAGNLKEVLSNMEQVGMEGHEPMSSDELDRLCDRIQHLD